VSTIKTQRYDQIKHLTIHCAATPEGRPNTAAEVTTWDVEKFGQPSYHWVIELDGRTTRTLEDTQIGAHVGGRNTGNIGVCYVGGMSKDMKSAKDTRTPAQRAAMKRLVLNYQRGYPGIQVRGHNEWPGVAKACPSFDVSEWLKSAGLA
jgi:N-acetylmuramoyl-L-alanine amidase